MIEGFLTTARKTTAFRLVPAQAMRYQSAAPAEAVSPGRQERQK